jgi:hypothetical protein
LKTVSKAEFKEAYFEYGNSKGGYDQNYWDKFFEVERTVPMAYKLQPPASKKHTRMMIVSDYGQREYRMCFLTEDQEERLYDNPGKK